jgi:hypothetical protein
MGFLWDTFLDNTPYPLEAVNLSLDTKAERNHNRPPLFRLGVATPDVVLDELNEMKRERESDQKRLASSIQQQAGLNPECWAAGDLNL